MLVAKLDDLSRCLCQKALGLKDNRPDAELICFIKEEGEPVSGEVLKGIEARDEHLAGFAPRLDIGGLDDHGGGDLTIQARTAGDDGGALEGGKQQRI